MNLNEARVDLDGMIVAEGSIRIPRDDKGLLNLTEHNSLRFSRLGSTMDLWTIVAERDPASGFMLTRDGLGVWVSLPSALSTIINKALRSNISWPQHATFSDHEEGFLAFSKKSPMETQLLSDWILRVWTEEQTLRINISAALFANTPLSAAKKEKVGHWSLIKNIPQRMEIDFSIDAATRLAAFGFDSKTQSEVFTNTLLSPSVPQNVTDAGDPFGTTLTSLDLSSAPIDTLGNTYVKMRSGPWAIVYVHDQALNIFPTGSLQRRSNGFLLPEKNSDKMSIYLSKIDFISVAKWMSEAPGHLVTVELKDNGWFGDLNQGRRLEDYNPRPRQLIRHAVLQFQITEHGLDFSYQLYVTDLDVSGPEYKPGWLEDVLFIPWELLLLRFPEFLRNRKAILKGLAKPL
jgi:hypothetical protein